MYVVFILTFFSMWFWAFFEQSGSSVNNFTDRNIDRVSHTRSVTPDAVGQTVQLRLLVNAAPGGQEYLSQQFLGHENGSDISAQLTKAIRYVESLKEPDKRMSEARLSATIDEVTQQPRLTMTALNYLREFARSSRSPDDQLIPWTFTEENVGRIDWAVPRSPPVFQSVNAIYIMLFGLLFTALWSFLGTRVWNRARRSSFRWDCSRLGWIRHALSGSRRPPTRTAWYTCSGCC